MTTTSNEWCFRRGLDPCFMEKLKPLAEGGWFKEVLADGDLMLGIRDNYVNVYWCGQSLFKITPGGKGGLTFSTHPKYLIDPGLSKAVPFDGNAFEVAGLQPFIKTFGAETLSQMKRAADLPPEN